MNRLSRGLIAVGAAILIYIGGLFGTSVLNNYHLRYLRHLGSSVVMIHNLEGNTGATGFTVKGKSGKLYIMTNGHVCDLEKLGPMFANYQGDDYLVKIYKRYKYNDLCALEAPSAVNFGFKVAKNYNLGESAYAIGHPQLEPLSVSVGELSDIMTIQIATGYNVEADKCTGPTYELKNDLGPLAELMGINNVCIRHLRANTSSISIAPGNSGSPIVDIYGQVIAVAFASNDVDSRSYHVPLSFLKDFLEQL